MNILEKLTNFYENVESSFDVQNWKINDIEAWPLIRILLGFQTIKNNSSEDNYGGLDTGEQFNQAKKLCDLLESGSDLDVLFIFDPIIRVKVDNEWRHRLLFPIMDFLKKKNYSFVSIEHYDQGKYVYPTNEEVFSIYEQIKYIRSSPLNTKINGYLPEIDKFFELYYKEFCIYPMFNINSLANLVLEIEEISFIIAKIIKKRNLKAIFVVNFYHPIHFGVALAGSRLGIPVIDVQHGNYSNYIYGNWRSASSRGLSIFPSHFWCWTESDASIIEKWSQQYPNEVIRGGNPWINYWKEKNIENEYSIVETEKICRKKSKNILVTLQPRYGLDGWTSNLPDWVYSVISKSPSNYKWFIRFHHHMDQNAIEEKNELIFKLDPLIKSGKVDIDVSNKKLLLELLRFMDVHITAHSTSVIEAEAMGVPSVTLHEKASFFFKKQIESGTVLMAKDQDSLIQAINHQLLLSHKEVTDHSNFFESNYNIIIYNLLSNKTSSNIVEKSNSIFEARLLVANREIDKLLELYRNNETEKDLLYYIGITLIELGQLQKSKYYVEKFLSSFNNKSFKTKISVIELDKLVNIHKGTKNKVSYNNVINYINNRAIDNDLIYGLFLKYLFETEQFIRLINCFKREDKNLDYLYFSGRCLFKLKKEEEAAEQLEKFIYTIENVSIDYAALTFSNNYIASSYFYLGEFLYNKGELVKSKSYLNKCSSLYNGTHRKAEQILKLIK